MRLISGGKCWRIPGRYMLLVHRKSEDQRFESVGLITWHLPRCTVAELIFGCELEGHVDINSIKVCMRTRRKYCFVTLFRAKESRGCRARCPRSVTFISSVTQKHRALFFCTRHASIYYVRVARRRVAFEEASEHRGLTSTRSDEGL